MRSLTIGLILSLSFMFNCFAQDSLTFKNESTIGAFLNNNKLGGSFQHYTGVVLKDFNIEAGLVLGLDEYEYFTLNPIGLALKTSLIKGKKIETLIGLNTGLGFFFFHKKEEQTKYQPQLFANPNLSFRFGKSNKIRFNVNVGYKYQKARITNINLNSNDFFGPQPNSKTVSDYKLQRLVLAAGIVF